MMHVHHMRYIIDAVTQGQMPAPAQQAATRFQGHDLTFVRSSANHVFRLTCQGAPAFLRLTHASERRRATIQAELDFIEYLAAQGLRVAHPLPSVTGALIEEIAEDDQQYYAVVFAAMPGQHLAVADLTQTTWTALGSTLGALHHASRTFPFHPDRADLRDILRALLARVPDLDETVQEVVRAGIDWLATFPAQDCGLIHGDFELDNLLWDGTQWGVIDFDVASYTWYGVDSIIALSDLWEQPPALRTQALAWFIAGYTEHRPFPAEVVAAIPRMLNLNTAIKIAQLHDVYASLDATNLPEWLITMRNRHQHWSERQKAALTSG